MNKLKYYFLALGLSTLGFSCKTENGSGTQNANAGHVVEMPASKGLKHPEWAKSATIYELNVRQYSPEGTFEKVEEDLQRIKDLSIDIIWLMPIHPIGEKNRKGSLGSYYSVQDYKKVNPEFGTLEDFKSFVDKAHEMGMYVIIDWVANHTAWDHPWATEHPEYYTKNDKGEFIPPMDTDWTDVIDLNFDEQGTRDAMLDALKYWVSECNIDGYRCDVAMEVPTDFWNNARKELDAIKPVFMLAEAEVPEHHHEAFDMSYGWHFHHLMNEVAKGKETAEVLDEYIKGKKGMKQFGADDYRMIFTSNHDENSWNGTVFERMGDASEAFAVFSGVFPGMPLIYNGQEAGMDKRLRFFEKDTIEWKEHQFYALYQTLNTLKHNNPALWNGTAGGDMVRLYTGQDKQVFAFSRNKGENSVVAVFNFSEKPVSISLEGAEGTYSDVFSGKEAVLSEKQSMDLPAWGYKVVAR